MADIEQSGILAGPEMLGHDAFVLDRHLVAGERDHSRALGAVPRIERKLVELLQAGAIAALGVAAVRRSPGLRRRSDRMDFRLIKRSWTSSDSLTPPGFDLPPPSVPCA